MNKFTRYKGFKIIPLTERICDKYSQYFQDYMLGDFLIINSDDSVEWQDSTLEHCKEWIDCY